MPAWFEEVSERLASRPIVRSPEAEALRPAAVLVPLQVEAGQIWVVLTRRSDTLPQHAGQFAFPGREREAGEEDEVANALRAAEEEIGIRPDTVMVLGQLDEVPTSAGLAVAPVVGAVPGKLDLAARGEGVSAVLRLPLLFLAQPELVEEQEIVEGKARLRSPVLHYRGQRIAGVTARILIDLLSRLGLLG